MIRDQGTDVSKGGDGALDAAQKLAGRVGSATSNVADATKGAGKQVGSVASDEMTKLKADLDDLIARLPSLSDVDLNAAKEKLLNQVSSVKDASGQVSAKVSRGMGTARGYVKNRPFKSAAIAAGIGVLLGMVIVRNR